MTRLNLPEKAIYPSCILPQERSNQLTAQWSLVGRKLTCKWLIG